MGLTQSIQSIPAAVGAKIEEAQGKMMKTQMARQLAMQNAMRTRQIAMQLALAKERLFVCTSM